MTDVPSDRPTDSPTDSPTPDQGGVYSRPGFDYTRDTRYLTTRILRHVPEGSDAFPVAAGRYRPTSGACRAIPAASPSRRSSIC